MASPTSPAPESSCPSALNGTQSSARKLGLLLVFCLAQFLDSFNNSALWACTDELESTLGLSPAQITWTFSAFQLTFSSFLLVSGRISDVYSPKGAFIAGVAGLAVFSLLAGLCSEKIGFLVLRALLGTAASFTVPSALTLIVRIFPESGEQARAIGVFGGCGSIGNILGFTVDAIFVEYATYRWAFYFVAIVSSIVAVTCGFLIPREVSAPKGRTSTSAWEKFKSLDLVGVSVLTIALILAIFALTTGSTGGWGSPEVIATLIVSGILIGLFFHWERIIPADVAAVPARTWFYPNFTPLFCVALLPFLWLSTVYLIFTPIWQSPPFAWSTITTAVHMIPLGIIAVVTSASGPLARIFDAKWIIFVGLVMTGAGTIPLIFGNSLESYWPIVFPGFLIGSIGMTLVLFHANVAIFRSSPPEQAGTVGAIFNSALQLGSALGISIVSSIQTSVNGHNEEGPLGWSGRKAALFFVIGVTAVEIIGLLIFYRAGLEAGNEDFRPADRSERGTTVKDEALVVGDEEKFQERAYIPCV